MGQAIQVSNGALHPLAIRYLGVALVALCVGVAAPAFGGRGGRAQSALLLVGLGAVLWQLTDLGSRPPAVYLGPGTQLFDFVSRLVVLGALAAGLVALKPTLGRWQVLAVVAAFLWLGAWLLRASPNPTIDVFTWTHYALEALKRGENPWAIAYPNIYHHTLWYAPGTADENWVHTAYPYPPLSLTISGLGYFLGGDMRWSSLALLAVAGAAAAWGGLRLGALGAAVLLTTPRIFFVVEQAWSDAYLLGLLGLVCWSWAKWKKALPVFLGLFLVSKQYMVLLAPLALLLVDPKWARKDLLRFVLITAAVGFAVNVPALLLGPITLLKGLTVGMAANPFRADALSFMAYTAENGQPRMPLNTQFFALVPVYALLYFRAPRGAAGFALGAALINCTFFAFSKHAFCNHHFMTLGAACIALSAMAFGDEQVPSAGPEPEPRPEPTT